MASTLTTIRRRFLRELEVGDFYLNAEITALTGSSFTSPQRFQDTAIAEDYLQARQAGIHRFGAASSVDFYRPAGLITIGTGLVAQRGLTWSDTSLGAEDIEMAWWKVRLDKEWLDLLNVEMAHETYTTMLAVSHLSPYDGDMILSSESNWTDYGTTTTSKVTTDGAIPWGQRAYHIVNTVADSGSRSTILPIRQGSSFSAFTIARILASVGTSVASLQGYDSTNSANIGTAVTTGEATPQLLCIQNQAAPATCKQIRINLSGVTTTSDVFFDQAWLYKHENLTCRLPSSLYEAFHAPKIIRMVPRVSTGTGSYDGMSFDPQPLVEGHDYRLVINHGDSEPYKIVFLRPNPYQWPIMVEAKLPLSSLLTFSAESDSTVGQIEKLMPRLKKAALEKIYNVGSRRHPDWEFQYNLANAQLAGAARARAVPTIAQPRPYQRSVNRL